MKQHLLTIPSNFVRKLYRLLSDPKLHLSMGWSCFDGDNTFYLCLADIDRINSLLTEYFRCQIAAFQQQLVDHGFNLQLKGDEYTTGNVWYVHKYFIRGCPNYLYRVVRCAQATKKLPIVTLKNKNEYNRTQSVKRRRKLSDDYNTKSNKLTNSSNYGKHSDDLLFNDLHVDAVRFENGNFGIDSSDSSSTLEALDLDMNIDVTQMDDDAINIPFWLDEDSNSVNIEQTFTQMDNSTTSLTGLFESVVSRDDMFTTIISWSTDGSEKE